MRALEDHDHDVHNIRRAEDDHRHCGAPVKRKVGCETVTIVNDAKRLEAIIRLLGAAEIKMGGHAHIRLAVLLFLGVSTSRVLRSWYWNPVWLELEGKDLQQMWTTCDRGDWLLWFCTHMIGQPGWPTHQQVVLASCQCARLALKYIKSGQQRPLKAIETAEAWARGEATLEQVQRAGHAADCITGVGALAYLAGKAAHSAAWAVYATEDGSCFRRAQAASDAASNAASAFGRELFEEQLAAHNFGPAGDADRDRAEKKVLRECAGLVRQLLDVPESLTDEFSTLQRVTRGPIEKTKGGNELWGKGYEALQRAKELYGRNELTEALRCLDSAIDSGFEGADICSMRGNCLQSLNFDLDAIDDLTRAIELDAEDSNYYFMRSLSRGAVGDLYGCVDDLNEAVRLAGFDSASTRSHNAHAREKGYADGVAGLYRSHLQNAQLDLEIQASDERRSQGPPTSVRPDLVTRRRSQARRRART